MVIIKKQGEIKKVSKEDFKNNYKQVSWEKVKEVEGDAEININDEEIQKLELLEKIPLEKLELLEKIPLEKLEQLEESAHQKLEEKREDLTISEIKELLDKNNIEYDSKAKKQDLLELLEMV